MKKLTSFDLKIIGIITMTIDHIGVFLYPDEKYMWMRIIGRISFPIFAFLITEGYKHTSNVKKYFLRLFALAIIFQIPLFFMGYEFHGNIFFTLSFGLIGIYAIENKQYNLLTPLILILYFIKIDYHYYGVLSILILYFVEKFNYKIISFYALNILFINILPLTSVSEFSIHEIQMFSMLSLVFISQYNGKRGYKMKYFFYLYYPLHILVINLIGMYL